MTLIEISIITIMKFNTDKKRENKREGKCLKKQINVGLLGLGTVGAGVYRMIENHQETLQHRVGLPINVKKILIKNVEKKRDLDIDSSLFTLNVEDVINDPDIDVVIEVMGGIEEPKQYIMKALEQGKHVVTANKDLMAIYSGELLSFAAKNSCDLFYEASVAGGIPILRGLVDGLSSDRIIKMMGIVNGTTNFILTKMTKDNASYDEVLKEAQALGFAESDPTSDVEGLDAARKMVILSTLGFSMKFHLDDVSVKGITAISLDDIRYAKRLDYTIKLIGIAERDNGCVEISVQPTLLPNNHPLASVNDEFNAVYIYGEAIGETMFYGPGAGQLPTATAVVSDLVTVGRNMRLGVNGKSLVMPKLETKLKDNKDVHSKYFLRFHVKDEAGAFSRISALFAKYNISLEKLFQQPIKGKDIAEVVVITHKTNQQDFNDTIAALKNLDIVHDVAAVYRVEGE